jgi:hypothetical protein
VPGWRPYDDLPRLRGDLFRNSDPWDPDQRPPADAEGMACDHVHLAGRLAIHGAGGITVISDKTHGWINLACFVAIYVFAFWAMARPC